MKIISIPRACMEPKDINTFNNLEGFPNDVAINMLKTYGIDEFLIDTYTPQRLTSLLNNNEIRTKEFIFVATA